MNVDAIVFGLFFCCLALVTYSYVGYPFILAMISPGQRSVLPTLDDHELPSVTVLVAAHNEASVIGQRVGNALASHYPRDRLEVLIVSDGSTDETEAIVASVPDERVRLLALHPNRGKSYALNRAIGEAEGEIIVMSDANTHFEPDAVMQLVRRLLAPDSPIAVCGRLILTDPQTGNNVDGLYWRYESWMKNREGALGAALGANGGIYAFWHERYCVIPDNTILDDMSIPLLMKLRYGGNIVFEESAVALEEVPPHLGDEFDRRVRIGIGAFQSLGFLWPLLHPRNGLTAFAFLSHKILRWITPHLLLLAICAALINPHDTIYRAVVVLALLAVCTGVFGRKIKGDSLLAKLMRLVSLFLSMNVALWIGFYRWLTTPQTGTWRRTTREAGQ